VFVAPDLWNANRGNRVGLCRDVGRCQSATDDCRLPVRGSLCNCWSSTRCKASSVSFLQKFEMGLSSETKSVNLEASGSAYATQISKLSLHE
jgi:hypothetical protein